jgi:hypothetical protein
MSFWLYLIPVALYLLYKWATSTYDYFEKQGIAFRKPIPLLGTNSNMITRRQTFTDALDSWYKEFPNEKQVLSHVTQEL